MKTYTAKTLHPDASDLNDKAGAEKSFKRALMYCKDKDRDGILFNLGNSLLDQRRYPAAIEVYDRISQKSALISKALKNRLIAEDYLSSKKKNRS